jgi:hypothetical protein
MAGLWVGAPLPSSPHHAGSREGERVVATSIKRKQSDFAGLALESKEERARGDYERAGAVAPAFAV